MYAGGARGCPGCMSPFAASPRGDPPRTSSPVVCRVVSLLSRRGTLAGGTATWGAASALAEGTCRASVSNAIISRDETRRRTYGPATPCIHKIPHGDVRVSILRQRKQRRLACQMSTSADMSAVGFPATVRQRVLVPGATTRPALSLGRHCPSVHDGFIFFVSGLESKAF